MDSDYTLIKWMETSIDTQQEGKIDIEGKKEILYTERGIHNKRGKERKIRSKRKKKEIER